MQGKTHAAIGAATYVFFCNKLPGKFNILGMIITICSALLADIDHPKSIVNKYILPIKNEKTKRVFYATVGIIILGFDNIYVRDSGLKAIAAAFIAISLNSHRNGFSHSFLGFVCFSIIGSLLEVKSKIPYFTFYIVIGYAGHLIGDMFTKQGIPLFYPVNNKKVKFPMTYVVGSKKGNAIESVITMMIVLYIGYNLMPWSILPLDAILK
ncbi:metal-dependent hydrolase [Hathewaya limosa]|uniref:Inner membrane protein n=1 Tax=Hathewaya limosa TaxID=1536 RepID=A0ABU0JUE2_HATLI|nr:metal-dependent hydrolase [Hathewaya limosa]MDQ0480723.1 inner membrane protein [Hathewaya limosa]